MSMNISVSGLKAAQQELNVTGHNIANVDTVGFKSFRNMFADVYAESGGKTAKVSGVVTQGTSQQFSQGNLQATGSTLDMGIEGSGFFTLKSDNNETFYSRAGYFGLNPDDYLVNNQGHKVQGFRVDDNGEVVGGALEDIHIERKSFEPNASTEVSAVINLDARDAAPTDSTFNATDPSTYNWATTFGLYDSLGKPHQLSLFAVLTTPAPPASLASLAPPAPWKLQCRLGEEGSFQEFDLNFKSDGILDDTLTDNGVIDLGSLDPGGGANPMTVKIDLTSATQFGQEYSIAGIKQDGHTSGKMNDIQVDNGGLVQALYSNGLKETQGRVALATFTNENGLAAAGNSNWKVTEDAGEPTYNQSGKDGAGVIDSRRLESSNVDLSSELVRLIVAQRNYQANARTLKAEDVVMQSLLSV